MQSGFHILEKWTVCAGHVRPSRAMWWSADHIGLQVTVIVIMQFSSYSQTQVGFSHVLMWQTPESATLDDPKAEVEATAASLVQVRL